ncbi:MAG: signal peptidase I [Candidatus Bathyarchaeia archaeon]
MIQGEDSCGAEADRKTLTSSRKEWLRMGVTLAATVLVIVGVWAGMVYLLQTSNPIAFVTGTSMLPVMREGDLVVLKGTSAQEISRDFQAGDSNIIIVFRSPSSNTFIIHRVIAVEYDDLNNPVGFRTQGYNVPYPDPGTVKESDIVGRVIYCVPYLGYLIIFFGSLEGRIISGAIIVILVIWTVVDERRRVGQAKQA